MPSAPAPAPARGFLASIPTQLWGGLNEGASNIWAGVRAAAEGVGGGPNAVSDFAANAENANQANATQAFAANQQYNGSPFEGGFTHALPWAIMQGIRMAPALGTMGLGGGLAAESAIGRMGGVAIANAPAALGEAYKATEGPDGQGRAGAALMMAPALDALNSWMPSHAMDIMDKAGQATIRAVGMHAVVTGAAQAVIGGTQTALTDAANPNLTPQDRIHNIVDGAISGGVLGGFFGAGAAALGGMRAVKTADPNALSTDNIGSTVDEALKALPAPQSAPMFADAAGRVAPSMSDIIATPRDTGMSPTDRIVAAATIPDVNAPPGIDYTTVQNDKQGSLRWAKPYEQVSPDDLSRPFRNATDGELLQHANTAGNYLDGLDKDQPLSERDQKISDYHQQILEELNQRAANGNKTLSTDPSQQGAGAVERTGDDKSGVADTASAPASATSKTWEEQRADLLKGAPPATRKAYADAKDLDDFEARNQAMLEKSNAPSHDVIRQKLEDLRGNQAVDAKEAGTPKPDDQTALANDNTKTTEPAAPANSEGGDKPVDADFQQQLVDNLGRKQGPAIDDLRDNLPANADDLKSRLFDLLQKGPEPEDINNPDGFNHVVDLAKQHGVLDDNGQYTDAAKNMARQNFAKEEDARLANDQPSESVAEAQDRGFTGTEISAFDSGARGEVKNKFDSIADWQAYKAGREWSAPKIGSDTGRDKADAAKLTPSRKADKRVRSAGIPEEASSKQFLNQAVDHLYGPSSTVRPQDYAQLKRMVREGANGKQLDEAARAFKDGTAPPPPGPAAKPFEPVRLDLTAQRRSMLERRTRERARAQLDNKLNSGADLARDAATIERQKNMTPEERNADFRDQIDAAHAQRYEDIKQRILDAHAAGDISNVEAIRLGSQLHQGDHQGVIDRLPGGPQYGARGNTGEFLNRVGELAAPDFKFKHSTEPAPPTENLRRRLLASMPREALREIAKNGTNPITRMFARMLDGDWVDKIHLNIVDAKTAEGNRGMAGIYPDGHIEVMLDRDSGINEDTFVHEMFHAATYDKFMSSLKNGSGELADQINKLHTQVVAALEKAFPALTRNSMWGTEVRRSADEMISWAISNPHAQEVLKSIDINGDPIKGSESQSLWDRFKSFVAKMFRIPENPRVMSALDHILDAGRSVLDAEQQADRAAKVPVPEINNRLNETVKLYSEKGDETIKGLLNDSKGLLQRLGDKIFPALLHTRSAPDLAEHFGRQNPVLPELVPWWEINQQSDAIPNVWTRIQRAAFDKFTKASKIDPKIAERVNNLAAATLRGVNGELPWAAHTWLHNDPQAGILKNYVDSVYRDAQKLKADGQLGIYHDLRDSLRAQNLAHMTMLLHNAIAAHEELGPIVQKLGDPMSEYNRLSDKHNATDAVKYWVDTLNNHMTSVERDFQNAVNAPGISDEDRARLARQMSPVQTAIKEIRTKLQATSQVPYFHAYREGDHLVSATIKNDGKRADPISAKAISDALTKAGFADATVAPELGNPSLFITVNNKSEREALVNVLKGLAAKGHIDGEIKAGAQARLSGLSPASQTALNSLINEVKANPMFDRAGKTPAEIKTINDQLAAVEQSMRESWLNSLSTTSSSRLMTKRNMVQGFSRDMIKSTNFRFGVGASALGRAWAQPRLSQVVTQMERHARDAMNVDHAQHADVDTIRMLVNHVRQRTTFNATVARHDWTDLARTGSNIFHIGLSPAMMLVDGSQMGVMVIPHLGARHGYSNALSAVARATPIALRVISEALKQGWDVSAARAADVAITHDVLANAVKDPATREFIDHIVGRGGIDMSSGTFAMVNDAGIGSNPQVGKALRMAAVMPQTTEMLSRIVTALAARELHGKSNFGGTAEDYAMKTIDNTLGHYGASSVPTLMSKRGPAGALGPMALQFKMFDMNLMWKLYREFHTAFVNKATSDDERMYAKKFLMGHAVAVTALSGTLGLPFAGAMAGAVDKLKDEIYPSEHPFDVTAEYRGYLAHMFGKDVGEVLAKGAPRAVGFDMSNRIGEGDLLPLTQFLTSRQKWSDTVDQWQGDVVGAPISMIADQAKGLDQIHNGNVLGGMATMLPTAIRNPIKAYQMSTKGYIDGQGVPLPMATPGAGAILAQLLGVTPQQKAEYTDEQMIQNDTHASLTLKANTLKAQILRALQAGDNDTAREQIRKATSFDAANPAYAVLPRIEQEMVGRERGQAESQVLSTPTGVRPSDTYGRGLTSGFSTVDYKAH
jgi:hypothetical protein